MSYSKCYGTLHILYMYFYKGVCKKKLKIRFLYRYFDVLISWILGVIKIHISSVPCKKILIFCERFFYVLNANFGNRKNSTFISLFQTRTSEKLRFCVFRSKNQNKLRLSRNSKKFWRPLYKNKYRGSAKFRNIPDKP